VSRRGITRKGERPGGERGVASRARSGPRPLPNPEQLRHTLASVLLSRNAPLLDVPRVGGCG